MVAYPHHGVHLGRPRPNARLLLLVPAAVAVGVAGWSLVPHHTGSSSGKGITDAQAVTLIQTGEGLPGLNVVDGAPRLHGAEMSAQERSYALRMYHSGPYQVSALNLLYAVGATRSHFLSATERRAIVAAGRAKLTAQATKLMRAGHPDWIRQYGVKVKGAARAVVYGMLVGATS